MFSTICKQVSRMGPALSNERTLRCNLVLHAHVCMRSPPPSSSSPPLSVLESFASCREEELIRRYFCQSNGVRAKRHFFFRGRNSDKEIWNDVNLQLFPTKEFQIQMNATALFLFYPPIEELITGYTR